MQLLRSLHGHWASNLFKSVPDLNTNKNASTYLSLYSLDGHLNLLKPNAISGSTTLPKLPLENPEQAGPLLQASKGTHWAPRLMMLFCKFTVSSCRPWSPFKAVARALVPSRPRAKAPRIHALSKLRMPRIYSTQVRNSLAPRTPFHLALMICPMCMNRTARLVPVPK